MIGSSIEKVISKSCMKSPFSYCNDDLIDMSKVPLLERICFFQQMDEAYTQDFTHGEIHFRSFLPYKQFVDTMRQQFCTLTTEKTGNVIPSFLDTKGKE